MKELKRGHIVLINNEELSELPIKAVVVHVIKTQLRDDIYHAEYLIYFEHYLIRMSVNYLLDNEGNMEQLCPFTYEGMISSEVTFHDISEHLSSENSKIIY